MQKIKNKLHKGLNWMDIKLLSFITKVTLIPTLLLNKVSASANVDLDFLKKADGSGPFSGMNDVAKEAGGSLYVLIRNIGLVVLLIGASAIGIGIAVTNNSNKRDEKKTHLLWFILGAVVFFSGFTIMLMAQKIANGITV